MEISYIAFFFCLLVFSYWITWNLPLTNEMKIDLLQIDCTAYRLRKQIELMTKVSLYFMYEFIPKFYLFFLTCSIQVIL